MIDLTSPSFEHQRPIPGKFTCDGENISPELQWSGLPQGTRSLALIVDDPDSPDPANPKMTWVHWVLYNIDPTANRLPEGVKENELPKGTPSGFQRLEKNRLRRPVPTNRRASLFS